MENTINVHDQYKSVECCNKRQLVSTTERLRGNNDVTAVNSKLKTVVVRLQFLFETIIRHVLPNNRPRFSKQHKALRKFTDKAIRIQRKLTHNNMTSSS